MTVNQKINYIQERLTKEGLDAYIIYGNDPHNSEYVCPRFRTRAFVTGFTGSAGTVIISKNEAFLFVDSRYHIQAQEQIEGTTITLFKVDNPGVPTATQFLEENINKYKVIGTAKDCLTKASFDALVEKGFEVVPCEDYLTDIWQDRPEVPYFKVEQMPLQFAGLSVKQKIENIQNTLKTDENLFISSLDDIAWVLNLRGSDIDFNPVFLSYLFINKTKAVLFADRRRFEDKFWAELTEDVQILAYEEAANFISSIKNQTFVINYSKTNMLIFTSIDKSNKVVNKLEITTEMKACKNEIELAGMKQAHVLDGAALVNFIARVKAKPQGWNELSITDELFKERQQMPNFRGEGFGPICGYKEHGAMCHYSATKESATNIEKGLIVLDTGGHYDMGLTDVTRTLAFGQPTEEERHDYTLVLKGHLALCRTHYPEGTSGYQLDVLARQFLWNEGLTYSHGTGHGVGHHLCVHEGPMSISYRASAVYPLKEGMVISDEPGLYKEGRHGIRIENLVAVTKAEKTEFGQFLKFEFITMVPYERELIDKNLLTKEEINQINEYHALVRDVLLPIVREESKDYLLKATETL